MLRVHRRNDDTRIGVPRGVASVSTNDPDDARTNGAGMVDRPHKIRADATAQVAAADGEDQYDVLRAEAAPLEPSGVYGLPPLVVGAGGELRDVIARRIGFDLRDLPEVGDRVRGVAGSPADSDDEEPSTAGAQRRQQIGDALDLGLVELGDDRRRLGEVARGMRFQCPGLLAQRGHLARDAQADRRERGCEL